MRRLAICTATVVCGLASAVSVQAQPVFETRESIEWQATDSDVIVRASIADVDRIRAEDKDLWDTITLKVHETLKGEPREPITFLLENSAGGTDDDLVMPAKGADRQFLFFFVAMTRSKRADKKYAPHKLVLRNDQDWWRYWAMYPLDDEIKSPVISSDLRILDSPKSILEATKAAITQSAMTNKVKQWSVAVPVGSQLYGMMIGSVDVPVDFRLERQARTWADSPDDRLRQSAILALSHFKSPANGAILRRLLRDPSYYEEPIKNDGRQIGVLREYEIRRAAYLVLQKWGEKTTKPTLVERIITAAAPGKPGKR